MNAWEERIYDREDGRKEGQKEKQNQIIAKMREKLTDQEIAELTGIPQEEVMAVPKL